MSQLKLQMSEYVNCSQRMGHSQTWRNEIHAVPRDRQASPNATPAPASCSPKTHYVIEFKGIDSQRTHETHPVAILSPADQSVSCPADDPRLASTELENGSLREVEKSDIATEPHFRSCGSKIGDLPRSGDSSRVLHPLSDPEFSLAPHKVDSLAVRKHSSVLSFGEHADIADPVFKSRTGERSISQARHNGLPHATVSDAGHIVCRNGEDKGSLPPSIDCKVSCHVPKQSKDELHAQSMQSKPAGPHSHGQQLCWTAHSVPKHQTRQDTCSEDVRCCVLLWTVQTYIWLTDVVDPSCLDNVLHRCHVMCRVFKINL